MLDDGWLLKIVTREREREGMKDYVPNEISEQNKATAKVSENQSRYILISYFKQTI